MLLSEFLRGKPRFRKKRRAYIDFYGYIMAYLPNHPRARSSGYVLLHFFLWEQYHNACLLKHARVVHLDKDKRNNSKDNLKATMGNNYKFKIYGMKSSIPT